MISAEGWGGRGGCRGDVGDCGDWADLEVGQFGRGNESTACLASIGEEEENAADLMPFDDAFVPPFSSADVEAADWAALLSKKQPQAQSTMDSIICNSSQLSVN